MRNRSGSITDTWMCGITSTAYCRCCRTNIAPGTTRTNLASLWATSPPGCHDYLAMIRSMINLVKQRDAMLLGSALALLVASLFHPTIPLERDLHNYLFIV